MPCDVMYGDEYNQVFLNESLLEGDDRWFLVPDWTELASYPLRCPHCSSRLWCAQRREYVQEDQDWVEEVLVAECPRCAHWQAMWYEGRGQGQCGCPTAEWEARIGKLAEFDLRLPEGCQSELAKYLRAFPHRWCNMSPQQLEVVVADVFKANFAGCDVMHVGKPGDGGVDVVFVDSGARRWLIQVKRRQIPANGEGVSTIRNLLGAMLLEQTKYGAVVSTADHFTYLACEAKTRAARMGLTVQLFDRGRLDRMLRPFLPSAEWAAFVRTRKPEWTRDLAARLPDRRQLTFLDMQHATDRDDPVG